MATGALRTNFADKRFMSQQRTKDTFFDYLLARLLEVTSRVWSGQAGIFGTTSLVSGGSDRFSVSGPFDLYLLDGDGNILLLDATYGTLVYFENELGITYSVGAKHVLIPKGVQRNPRIGTIHYDTDEDMIGERAEPDAVVEAAGTLEITVDSVCEVGVSNAGRSVTVWMKKPRSTDEAVAIERNLTVVFSGGVNKVTTSGLLGQGSPASTDPADYEVALQGLTVKRNTDLSVTDPYAFIGTVTGGGAGNPPGAFGTAGQIDVSDGVNPDLQTAYLAGRTITPGAAAGGAVKIESSTAGGELRALLELVRKGAVESSPQALAILLKRLDGTGILELLPLQNLPELQEDEAGQTGAVGTLNLTRVGVDAVVGGVDADLDLVRMWDFTPTTGMNRFYRITSVAAAQLQIAELDGSPVAGPWGVGENGNVGIYRVRLSSGEKNAVGVHPASRAPLTLAGQPALDEDETLLRLFPEGATNSAEFADDQRDVVGRFTRAGVLHLLPNNKSRDPMGALLRLRQFGSTFPGQFGLVAEMGRNGYGVPIACLSQVRNGVELEYGELVDLGAATNDVVFTRVGVDLTLPALRIRPGWQLVYLYDTVDPAEEGLYVIDVVASASTLEVKNLDGTTPSFGGDSVKAHVLLPRFVVGDASSPWTGTVLTCADGEGNPSEVRVYPEKGILRILDNGLAGAAANVPRDLVVLDADRVNSGDLDHPVRFARSVVVRGGDVSGGGGEESFYSRDGVRIWNAGGLVADRDPAFPLAVDAGFPEDVPTFHTIPAIAFDEWGSVNRGHHFRDDFCGYDPLATWTNAYPQPARYKTAFVGAGTIRPRDMSIHQRYGHGCVQLETGAVLANTAELYTPGIFCNLDTDKGFRWTMRAVLRMQDIDLVTTRIGLTRSTGNEQYYFSWNATNVSWELHYWDGAVLQVLDLGVQATVDLYQWFQIRVLSSTLIAWAIDCKSHPANHYGSGVVSVASLAGNAQGVGPDCLVVTNEAVAKAVDLDYWEVYDREIVYARHGTSYNQVHP